MFYYYLLPFGLFQSIANAISKAFKWIFDKVLTPILKMVIMNVVMPVVEIVIQVLYDILIPVFLAVLQILLTLLDVIEQAFNIFSGTSTIQIRDSLTSPFRKEYLMNVIFGQNTVSTAFWYITLIAFMLTMAFTIVSVMRSTMDLEGKRPVGKVLGSTGKAMLSFLLVPFVVICTINLSSLVLVKSSEAISLASGVPETTIGTHLFLTLCVEAYKSPDEKTQKQIKDAYYNPNDVTHVYTNTKQVEADFNIKKINYAGGYIVCIALALMMIIASFLFIVRIFEVVILYIVSPFFVATMPLDEGARFKSWRDLFIAKLVAGFGMVYAMKVYILLIPVLLGTNVRFFDNVYKNTIMQLVFMLGGSFAVVKSNSLIMQAVNPSVAATEAAGAGSAMGFAMVAKATAVGMGRNAFGGVLGGAKGGAGRLQQPYSMMKGGFQESRAAEDRWESSGQTGARYYMAASTMATGRRMPAALPGGRSGPVIGAHRSAAQSTPSGSGAAWVSARPSALSGRASSASTASAAAPTTTSAAMPPKPDRPAPTPPPSKPLPVPPPKPPK